MCAQNDTNKEASRHPDGSPCLKGTQRVPKNYVPCCEFFDYRTRTCAYDIRYEYWKGQGWMIVIVEEAGGGGIAISYCPHCGTRLSGKRRNSVEKRRKRGRRDRKEAD